MNGTHEYSRDIVGAITIGTMLITVLSSSVLLVGVWGCENDPAPVVASKSQDLVSDNAVGADEKTVDIRWVDWAYKSMASVSGGRRRWGAMSVAEEYTRCGHVKSAYNVVAAEGLDRKLVPLWLAEYGMVSDALNEAQRLGIASAREEVLLRFAVHDPVRAADLAMSVPGESRDRILLRSLEYGVLQGKGDWAKTLVSKIEVPLLLSKAELYLTGLKVVTGELKARDLGTVGKRLAASNFFWLLLEARAVHGRFEDVQRAESMFVRTEEYDLFCFLAAESAFRSGNSRLGVEYVTKADGLTQKESNSGGRLYNYRRIAKCYLIADMKDKAIQALRNAFRDDRMVLSEGVSKEEYIDTRVAESMVDLYLGLGEVSKALSVVRQYGSSPPDRLVEGAVVAYASNGNLERARLLISGIAGNAGRSMSLYLMVSRRVNYPSNRRTIWEANWEQ